MDYFPFFDLTDDELYAESTQVENFISILIGNIYYISWNNQWWPYDDNWQWQINLD
jgi:hypothetical protein